MKKTLLPSILSICLFGFFVNFAFAEDNIVNWAGSFINQENGMTMHNNSVRINKLGIGYFPTGFYQDENTFLCSGTVALGENLHARISNFMFYKYEISEDEHTIVVSKDTQVPMEYANGCTEMFYGTYVRMP